MEVSYTYDPGEPSREEDYMVIASKAEWQELLANLDGIGHSEAALHLIDQFKTWGIEGK